MFGINHIREPCCWHKICVPRHGPTSQWAMDDGARTSTDESSALITRRVSFTLNLAGAKQFQPLNFGKVGRRTRRPILSRHGPGRCAARGFPRSRCSHRLGKRPRPMSSQILTTTKPVRSTVTPPMRYFPPDGSAPLTLIGGRCVLPTCMSLG